MCGAWTERRHPGGWRQAAARRLTKLLLRMRLVQFKTLLLRVGLRERDKTMQERLLAIRTALLNLHKALVDAERVRYEKIVGPIPSPNYFLQLLTDDPWFAWLHPLSQLIVSMDEAMDGGEPLTAAGLEALVQQSGRLLEPQESSHGFAGHYYDALQNDPDVIMAHAEATKAIRAAKTPA